MNVAIIGAGNVAWSLARGLGDRLGAVWAPTYEHAREVSSERAVPGLDDLPDTVDTFIICVKDDAILEVVNRLRELNKNALWVHTSGSTSIDVLDSLPGRHGVVYPMQTFTRGVDVDLSKVTFFTEGDPGATLLAKSLSSNVIEATGEQRMKVHMAAVYACNFVNHMWALADDILAAEGIPFNVLKPLLHETLRKALAGGHPARCQTGPAIRGDQALMQRHLAALDTHKAQIYSLLSQSIQNEPHRL